MLRRIAPLVAMVAFLPACGDVPKPADGPGEVGGGPTASNPAKPEDPGIQGLSQVDRDRLFHLSTGSEMVPLSWLKALTNVRTGKPFMEDLERYGFVPDPKNPDGLPVGLTVTESKAFKGIGKMVGANCAACHVGEITKNGKSLVILGAPNLLDFNNFVVDLNESVQDTLKPTNLARFVERLAASGDLIVQRKAKDLAPAISATMKAQGEGLSEVQGNINSAVSSAVEDSKQDLAQLRTKGIEAARESLAARLKSRAGALAEKLDPAKVAAAAKSDLEKLKSNISGGLEEVAFQGGLLKALLDYHSKLAHIHEKMTPEPGPGRIDAFGAIRDAVLSHDDFIDPTAPVSYPHIWLVNQTVWFHWDGNTNSMLQRDVGQTLGLGAIFNTETFFSTVLPQNLNQFEHMVWQIRSPKWPEDMLGAIDTAKADRGKGLYAKHCLECHAMAKPYDSLKKPPPYLDADQMKITKLDKIGTDPGRVKNFSINIGRNKDGSGGSPFAPALGKIAYDYTEKALAENGISAKDAADWDRPEGEVKWPVNDGYVGRPLAGIWATGPFLHNGSVPSLDDLLLPADKRPTKFYVGSREFDAKRVGYVSREEDIPSGQLQAKRVFSFDTSLPGNLRTGHEYGTDLTPDQRGDLLEFLKTL